DVSQPTLPRPPAPLPVYQPGVFRMRRILTQLALGLCAFVVAGSQASADYILGLSDVQADTSNNTLGAVPGVAAITIPGNNGESFTNSYLTSDFPPPTGTTLTQGVGLRAVAANIFQNYVGPGNNTLQSNVNYNGNQSAIVAVTALSG